MPGPCGLGGSCTPLSGPTLRWAKAARCDRPRVLLCDEPTSALDAETTRELLATLRAIHRTLGVTLVIVTHELAVVRALCTQAAVIEQGRLIEQFAVAEVASLGRSALARELAREQQRGLLQEAQELAYG